MQVVVEAGREAGVVALELVLVVAPVLLPELSVAVLALGVVQPVRVVVPRVRRGVRSERDSAVRGGDGRARKGHEQAAQQDDA